MDATYPKHSPTRRLPLPVAFPDIPPFLVQVADLTSADVRARLGEPERTSDGNGLGPCDAWAFEYQCGLQLVYQYYHLTNGLLVVADSPEVQHVRRHVPFPADRVQPIPEANLARELDFCRQHYPEREKEIRELRAFQVWRMDDNGNVFAVDDPTSERDANCRAEQLQRLGHKQTYWYERRQVGVGHDPPVKTLSG